MTESNKLSYYTIQSEGTAKLTEKNSRFLAYALSIANKTEALEYLNQIKQLPYVPSESK